MVATRQIYPMFDQCWPTVYDGAPALVKHRVDLSCLLAESSQMPVGLNWPLPRASNSPKARLYKGRPFLPPMEAWPSQSHLTLLSLTPRRGKFAGGWRHLAPAKLGNLGD